MASISVIETNVDFGCVGDPYSDRRGHVGALASHKRNRLPN